MTGPTSNRYVAVPQSGKGPGVLVLHAWWGLNDFIRELCDRLAQEGFVAYAPDLFYGVVARTIEEAEQHVDQYNEAEETPPQVLAAVEALCKHPAVTRGVGVVGFSFGAYWSLWLAQQKPELIRAVTLFYGTDGGSLDFQGAQAAFLGHFAETDKYEPAENVRALEKNLKAANRPVTFYTYPGTGHWFFEKDREGVYNTQHAQAAWERTVAFLHEHLDETAG